VASSPAVADEKIVIGCDDGSVYCFGQKVDRQGMTMMKQHYDNYGNSPLPARLWKSRRRSAITSSPITRPSPFGSRSLCRTSLAALERPPAPGTPLGVYLHIPFCRKRCHFCYFKVYTDKDSAAIRGYIDAALQELALYAAKPIIGGRKANFRLFRRRHAVLSFGGSAQASDRRMKKLIPGTRPRK
jgi:hypothetical protein